MNFATTASIFLPLFITGCDFLFPPCTNYKREVCTCDDAGAAMCKVAEAVEKQAKKYKDNDDDAKYDSLQDTCEKALESWDKADGCDQFSGGGGGGGNSSTSTTCSGQGESVSDDEQEFSSRYAEGYCDLRSQCLSPDPLYEDRDACEAAVIEQQLELACECTLDDGADDCVEAAQMISCAEWVQGSGGDSSYPLQACDDIWRC